MANKKKKRYEIVEPECLDIFLTEKDRVGKDVLSMSNYFMVLAEKSYSLISTDDTYEIVTKNINKIQGEIATAIKTGLDISKAGILIADSSHFSKDIVDGLKMGIYQIGESKEVSGQLRPAIVDNDGKLVKFFTLKRASDPSVALSGVSNLALQKALQQISRQLDDLQFSVDYIVDHLRLQSLNKPFLNARDLIIAATDADCDDKESKVKKALEYLNDGANSVYLDLEQQTRTLAKVRNKRLKTAFASIKHIDSLLNWICEDIKLMNIYFAVQLYYANLVGTKTEAKQTIDKYNNAIRELIENELDGRGTTAAELIHMYSKYDEDNLDCWLELPNEMLDMVDNYQTLLNSKKRKIYCIEDVEEAVTLDGESIEKGLVITDE